MIVCWLEDGRVKVGDKITLRDYPEPDREWVVEKDYSTVDDKHLNRGWNNNI